MRMVHRNCLFLASNIDFPQPNIHTESHIRLAPPIMKPKIIPKNQRFIGREDKLGRFKAAEDEEEAAVIIVYGRRRIGKTELIEQHFRTRNLLKFEGIQPDPKLSHAAVREYEIGLVLSQLAEYAEAPHFARLKFERWKEIFDLLASLIATGSWTLYFEEVQWLANYHPEFFAELKSVWDNQLRHNKDLIIVLCGSSPSFISGQLIASQAFYSRTNEEILLRELSLQETRSFLGEHRSLYEVLLGYLTVGGVPGYLKYLAKESSVLLSLCKHSFLPNAYFLRDAKRVFVSSLRTNSHFEATIHYLSKKKYATREEIARNLKIKAGGSLTELLNELEACAFIERYTPVHLSENSTVVRYCISDNYLQFYYKFIAPLRKDIEQGAFQEHPTAALEKESFQKWLGFAFQRFCRTHHQHIARILGFSGIKYQAGAYFHRDHLKKGQGFQIDLLFIRADHVITVCEVRYSQTRISTKIINELERKISFLREHFQKAKHATIERVLITTEGADDTLTARAYLDRVITLEDLFSHT